jgi:hypothetical protein
MPKTKIDKEKLYLVKFKQIFNDVDTIEQIVSGRKFYRLRNFLRDLGYEVSSIEELK